MDELSVVVDLQSAARAIELIVVQGEGSTAAGEHSHFEQFQNIRREYEQLLLEFPAFEPARRVAVNPLMRVPLAADRVHASGPDAAPLLDAANAVDALMLRFLTAVCDVPSGEAALRKVLLEGAITMMKMLRTLSDALTSQPAQAGAEVNGGVSFAMPRNTEGLVPGVDSRPVLVQRLRDLADQLPCLSMPEDARQRTAEAIDRLIAALGA